MMKKIDHIAIAVKDLDEEIRRYKDILGLTFCGTEVVEEQKVRAAFFSVGDVNIELTAPTSADSPIAKFLAKKGNAIHHISFEVDNIESQVDDLIKKNVRMIDRKPKIGAANTRIAFIHPQSFPGVLFELKEKVKKTQSET